MASITTSATGSLLGGLGVLLIGALLGWGVSLVRGYVTLHRRVNKLVEDVKQGTADIAEIKDDIKSLRRNGGDTNDVGDLVYRIAAKVGVLVPEA